MWTLVEEEFRYCIVYSSLRETQCHAEQMIGANAAALEENGRRLSEGRGVYDEVKGLEVRVDQSKESYAMYDESLSVMSQVSYLLSGLFQIFLVLLRLTHLIFAY